MTIVLIVLFGAPGSGFDHGTRAWAGGGEGRAADIAAIREHIDSIYQAYIREDRRAIRETHHPRWAGFFRTSKSPVRGIKAYMGSAEAFFSSGMRMTGYEMRQFDVVFHGETAVVTYLSRVTVNAGGEPGEFEMKAMDVYVRADGTWQQVAAHTAALDPSD